MYKIYVLNVCECVYCLLLNSLFRFEKRFNALMDTVCGWELCHYFIVLCKNQGSACENLD